MSKVPELIGIRSSDLGNDRRNSKKNPKNRSIGHYILGKTIGEGTFGKVKKAIHILTGEPVAIKILEKDRIIDVADVERVSREIHILKLIRHPHVIQLYEIIETPKQLFLVMEFADGGELFDFIISNKRVADPEASRIFWQITSGIEYLHKLNIVHRDLKPENLLFDHNVENRKIKIVDFGLSNTYGKNELLKTACGSPCYAAPEMIAGKSYDGLMVDIWSCGVILFVMLCGYLPFEDANTGALYKKILNNEYVIHEDVSQPAEDLIRRILTTDPNKRIKIEEIKRHPWIQQYNDIKATEGIIIGYNRIPIDYEILKQLEVYDFNLNYAQQCIDANKHNHVTTTYYLLLKKYFQNGGKSPADLNCDRFDHTLITPNTLSNKPEARKKTDLCEIFNNNSLLEGQSCEKSHQDDSKNKFAQILQIISDEICEKNRSFIRKSDIVKENSNVELLPEDPGQRVEHPKHARYRSLITKFPNGNNLNSSSINPEGKTHKNANNLTKIQQNKSFDLEKQLSVNYATTPNDPKIQTKALHGYFFPNNYIPNNSLIINNNTVFPTLNASNINHERKVSVENAPQPVNKPKPSINNAATNHKRTKSVNPSAKTRPTFIQTPKKTTVKKEVPLKSNINKSTTINKQLDTSLLAMNHEYTHTGNHQNLNNSVVQPHNLQNEFNSVKTTKPKPLEKKAVREPRNVSANARTKPTGKNLRKEGSNEKKGKFLV